jgi:excisionase family DNA binding protein
MPQKIACRDWNIHQSGGHCSYFEFWEIRHHQLLFVATGGNLKQIGSIDSMTKEMLSTKEVAEYLSINEKQAYRLIKEKKTPATRVTGKWLFPKGLIDEWVMNSARESVSPPARRGVSGYLLRDLIAASLKLGPDMYGKSIAVAGARDGNRSVLSLSEIINRSDNQDILLIEKKEPGSGRYRLYPAGDYFADRDVRAVERIEIINAD